MSEKDLGVFNKPMNPELTGGRLNDEPKTTKTSESVYRLLSPFKS